MHNSYCRPRKARSAGENEEATAALYYARGQVIRALQLQKRAAVVLEETKADYLLPQTMREWSSLRPFLISTLDFLDRLLDNVTDAEPPGPVWIDE